MNPMTEDGIFEDEYDDTFEGEYDADLRTKIDYIFAFCKTVEGMIGRMNASPMARNMLNAFSGGKFPPGK